mmetsp:Transcript_35190/g.53999  ORF Transcript_35190/g.53999 Transcript_35190/m.53999 type:complete len:208 (-) Transcript_35190:608-1231(-)
MSIVVEFWEVFGFGQSQCQRNNRGDTSFRTVNMNWKTCGCGNLAHHFQSFLVVWPSSTNPNINLMLLQLVLIADESLDETCKRCSNIREVRNTTPNNEDFSTWIAFSCHKPNESLGILIRVLCTWSPRVFTIVGKLVTKAEIRYGISIDNRCSTTSNHGPDPACVIEDRKFERSTSLAVQFSNVGFFGELLASKWCWEIQMTPLASI